MSIRDFEDRDEAAFIGLLREMQGYESQFNEHYKPAGAMGLWYLDLVKAQCRKCSGAILMAEVEGRVLGMAVVLTRVEETGEEEEAAHNYALVSELVVTEAARSQGIGRALLAACENRVRLAGQSDLRIAVFAANTPAHGLYSRVGFADSKVIMRKRLA